MSVVVKEQVRLAAWVRTYPRVCTTTYHSYHSWKLYYDPLPLCNKCRSSDHDRDHLLHLSPAGSNNCQCMSTSSSRVYALCQHKFFLSFQPSLHLIRVLTPAFTRTLSLYQYGIQKASRYRNFNVGYPVSFVRPCQVLRIYIDWMLWTTSAKALM
jgi:hypothetical protein